MRSTPTLPASFRRLAWSNLAAQSADQIALASAPIVAVLTLHASAEAAGTLLTFLTLPFLVFSIPAGVLADRLTRPLLMAAAEALRTLSLFLILVLILTDHLNLIALSALGFISVCGTVVYTTAAPAVVPQLVEPDQRVAANSRIELARTIAFTAGPALGGTLIGWAGASFAFGLATGLSILAVVFLSGIHEPSRPIVPKRHPWLDIAEGINFVNHHPLLRPIFITQFIFSTAMFVMFSILVPYLVQFIHLTAVGIGWTMAFYGIGMIAGALAAPALMRAFPQSRIIAIGPITAFIASTIMALTLVWPNAILCGLALFVFGAGPILWVISTTTLRQAVTPPTMLGRVSALSVFTLGSRPLGSIIGAVTAAYFGMPACLLLAVLGFLIQMLVLCSSPAVQRVTAPI